MLRRLPFPRLLPLLALAGCSSLAPFETVQPAEDEHAICYSRLAATPDQVREVAAGQCTAGTEPRLLGQGMNLAACPLLTPIRAIFACQAH